MVQGLGFWFGYCPHSVTFQKVSNIVIYIYIYSPCVTPRIDCYRVGGSTQG